LLTHGSSNEIFLVDGKPAALFGSAAETVEFVRAICDRAGPLGADGVYFVDDSADVVEALFYNPDGSVAKLCGNGLRCVGRLVLERRNEISAVVTIGVSAFEVRRVADVAPGVPGIAVTLPPVSFHATDVPLEWAAPECVDSSIPALHPSARFSALAVPNSHLVAVVDTYDEGELAEVAGQVRLHADILPQGANLSFLKPLGDGEIFVATFERGVGLTPSCGSAVVASRAVFSRLGYAAPEARVTTRNPGGSCVCLLAGADGSWTPTLEGNATFVYRARVSADQLRAPDASVDKEIITEEVAAFGAYYEENLAVLRRRGVVTSAASRMLQVGSLTSPS
jgi:diaminopimelate epimerase